MFRLPTHLESLVPPPGDQVPQSQPWRGTILLPAASPHPSSRPREIRVTAAETENDNQQDTWPASLHLQLVARRAVLRDVHAWLAQMQPGADGQYHPRCIIMPDRLPDHAASQENQAMFEAFARQLLEDEIVAIAQWGPSSGILFYPTPTTRALLVGIVFLNQALPDFIHASLSHSSMGPPPGSAARGSPGHPSTLQGGAPGPSYPAAVPRAHGAFQPSPYDPAPPNIASSSRYSAGGLEVSRGRSGRHSG